MSGWATQTLTHTDYIDADTARWGKLGIMTRERMQVADGWSLLHGWVACRACESRSNLAGNRVLRLLAPQRFFAASDRLYLRVRTATSNREQR
jgi:hypothetical protein